MYSTNIPNRIREWRNRRRMSLAELGEIVGLSRSEISKLESGSRRVRADHLVVLARALKITPDDLMDQTVVRELIGEPVPGATVLSTLAVAHAKRQNGAIVILRDDTNVTVEAPPQVANVPGAYAFYMPDTSLEPRVPVGALLFVNPMLPPRAGDMAVVATDNQLSTLASIERRANALVAVTGGEAEPIDLNNPAVSRSERIAGMWFP